ncbi:MAG: DUF481 domain-containing protein [Alphaproteobacteria bacterium]|nr:DUF481 domain-containing protein [Alphaproteobacteria bacterium]
MQKQTLTAFTFLASALIAPQVQAQNPFPAHDRSVTLYSLDGPAEPIRYEPPRQRPSSYPVSDRTITHVVEDTTKDTAEAEDVPAPDTGLWGAVWSGRANIGATLQDGNSNEKTINADAEIQAEWMDGTNPKHRATLKADYNREEDNGQKTEDNRSVEGMYDYFFNPKWFLNNNAKYEQDDISDLDYRVTAGMGLGYQAFKRDDLNLQFILGPSYLREEFANGDSEDSVAIREATEYDQKFWDDFIQLFHEHELLVPTDDTDAFLFDSESGVRVPLRKGLVATAEVEFDWDNAPAPGVEEGDTTYALKLGYEW